MRFFGVTNAIRPPIAIPPAAMLLFALCAGGTLAQGSLDRQLLINPGAEDGPASPGGVAAVGIPGWNTRGTNFTVDTYAPPPSDVPVVEGQRIGGGKAFFTGGPNNAASVASQLVDVSSLAGQIDAGGVTAILSAQMTAYLQQNDNGTVYLYYRGADSKLTGLQLRLGPQPGNFGEWQYYRATGTVPPGTRTLEVQMSAIRVDGSFNDANFDNLSLFLTKTLPTPPQAVTPPVQNFHSDNLLVNGDAEGGAASANGIDPVDVPGWQLAGHFTVVGFGSAHGLDSVFGASVPGNKQLFVGGAGPGVSSATQTVDLSANAADIDAGSLRLSLNFYMGVSGASSAGILLEELDAAGNPLFTRQTPASPSYSVLGALARQWPVVPGTRSARLTLQADSGGADYSTAYFDSLTLRLIDALTVPGPNPSPNGPVPASYGNNLLLDPGAEDAAPDFVAYQVVTGLPGWTTTGNFSTADSHNADFAIGAEEDRINGGRVFFAGGPSTPFSTAAQTIDLNDFIQDIDGGKVSAHLEGQLGGFGVDGDNGAVIATFLNAVLQPLGTVSLYSDNNNDNAIGSYFNAEQADGNVPPGTRSVQVMLVAQRLNGSYNDTYFDNLSFSLNRNNVAPQTLGDVDGDGKIGPGDVILILRATLNLTSLTPEQRTRADMNDDGRVTVADAALLLRRMVEQGQP